MPDSLIVQSGGTDLVVDAAGPDALVVQLADGLTVELADDPLDIMFAAVGMPGRDGADGDAVPVQAVAAASMPVGTPVAIDRTTSRFIAADAAFKPAAFVVGLLSEVAVEGFVAAASPGRLTLPDWSAVAGTVRLAPGQPYFLADGGGLTTVPPSSGCVAMIGTAVDWSTLLIDPQTPIQL